MQIYAIATGSFVKGAWAMFLFSIGTVPLMMIWGIIFKIIKGQTRIWVNKITNVMMVVLAIFMLNRGLTFLGVNISKSNNYDDYISSRMLGGYQEISFDLSYDGYQDILVQKGVPVKLIINVSKEYLAGCNEIFTMEEWD